MKKKTDVAGTYLAPRKDSPLEHTKDDVDVEPRTAITWILNKLDDSLRSIRKDTLREQAYADFFKSAAEAEKSYHDYTTVRERLKREDDRDKAKHARDLARIEKGQGRVDLEDKVEQARLNAEMKEYDERGVKAKPKEPKKTKTEQDKEKLADDLKRLLEWETEIEPLRKQAIEVANEKERQGIISTEERDALIKKINDRCRGTAEI